MKTLLPIAAALCIAAPAWAQVPAQAGAPTDQPLPPEPGQQQGTDRTLDPSETDLPQADIRTRSEQEEMGQMESDQQDATTQDAASFSTETAGAGGGVTGNYGDVEQLDREWADLDRRSRTMSGQQQADLQRSLADLRTRREAYGTRYGTVDLNAATPQDREAMMRDYDMLSGDVMRARYSVADQASYDRLVRDQFTMYDRGIEQRRMAFQNAPADMRAERALDLIRLRRQRDALNLQQRGLRRAQDADYETRRRTLTDDLIRYDTASRRSMMGEMSMDMNGGMPSGNRPMNEGGNN